MKTVMAGSNGMVWGIVLVVLLGAVVGFALLKNPRSSKLITEPFSEPLNGASTVKVDIHAGSGNLTIDRIASGEPVLASGSLQYFENNIQPTRTLDSSSGQATFALKMGDGGQRWLKFPWDACNGATEWQIHLNPTVSSDITAYSGGGNIRLDLAGMSITHVSADTGGGNVDVVLPENAANLNVDVRTGAGNVTVHLPAGTAARIHATTGLGTTILDPRFSKIDKDTYQSTGYDSAASKVEMTLKSGAGNVTVAAQ